jgi:hypothetical protein
LLPDRVGRSSAPLALSATVEPWREPLADWIRRCGDPARAPLALSALNAAAADRGCRSAGGRRLRFVAGPPAERPSAQSYERRIWEHGEILTRLTGRGACHDGFNALCWLAFPRIRAALNALQMQALSLQAPQSTGPIAAAIGASAALAPAKSAGIRGRLRDRVTLFDESGAVLVSRDRSLPEALHRADWESLFVAGRERWRTQARLLVVGHALHEKLVRPYKAICARVFVLDADPDQPLEALDGLAADAIAAAWASGHGACATLEAAVGALPPLPLLGIPGWCPDNDDPAFYRDPLVFRPRRQ